ncbi:PAS domain-containing sensor histidine kinase [Pedobacter sp.]|uniref:PAS domain-containing sensor histidine kinase n=1 Tax=Pedobacter sp. TaxID=1411316 RepID=UPI003BA87E01
MEDFLRNLAGVSDIDPRLLAAALNASSNGVVITDHLKPDEPIIYCNDAFETLTGYERINIIGHNCRFLQADDRDQKSRQEIKEAIRNGEHCQVLIKNYRKNAKLIWNELIISPVRDKFGVVTHFIGIQNDVSKRVLAEQKLEEQRDRLDEKVQDRTQSLEESEKYLSAIVETIRESLIVLDSELKVVDANENFCDFFRQSREDIIGQKFFSLGSGEWDIPELKELLINVLPHNNPFEDFEFESEFFKIGKRVLILNARQMVLKGKSQERILLAIEDITERKVLEYRKEDFINIASHEMKTPLTSIKGNLQMLQKIAEKRNDVIYTKGFQTASRSIQRLENLIYELLDASKMQLGKVQFKFEEFSVSQLLKESVDIIAADAPDHQFLITGDINQSIDGDMGRLEQVMINLLSNAVKYSPKNSEISIHVSCMSGYCKISVKDSGLGISSKDHKRIFERFFRTDDTAEKFPGVGVGLYVCNYIIKEHQGSIWVDSEHGHGSIFSFTVPIKRAKG